MGVSIGLALVLVLTAVASSTWKELVLREVPNPYLDEVFHIRQAQVYCAGDFQTWDPKITTPPGLYLVSYLAFRLTGRCDIDALRTSNVVALCLIVIEAYQLINLFSRVFGRSADDDWKSAHTALNVALFPPIFFFSGLYYTDLQSLLVVMLSIHLSLLQVAGHQLWHKSILQYIIGAMALAFRQTNVFWVAIFPIALSVLDQQRLDKKESTSVDRAGSVQDYVEVAFDMVITALSNVPALLSSILPQIAISITFIAFIAWNGSVVLGDKTNHVATIHITQMLYMWPFFMFFSWPLVSPMLLRHGAILRSSATFLSGRPRTWSLLLFMIVSVLIIHYNTIIHPFTLADNRHYMFYVFKLLRRHWLLRYAAAPVYVICAWLCLRTAEISSTKTRKRSENKPDSQSFSTSDRRIGLVLVWLATAALSLVTAPLVEPRYFLVPWVLWRLMICTQAQTRSSLALETMWYLVVNAGTGYMFLYRPFSWAQEPGAAQRFMW